MIDLCDVRFHFGDTPVLQDVNLQIHPGESVAIIGANGSGKTTLARCLNGLITPQSGSVCIDGIATANRDQLPTIRRTVGMVFQNPDDQLVATTVESELAFGLENLTLSRREMHARIERALGDFDLLAHRHSAPNRLSGGEKQRLAIAAASAMQPRYLVLDEPTALLDPQHRLQVIELLQSLREAHGIATILITQLPDEAASAARIIALRDGRVLLDGPPDAVYADVEALRAAGLEAPFARRLFADDPTAAIGCTLDHVVETWKATARPTAPPMSKPDKPSIPAAAQVCVEALSHTYEAQTAQPQPSLHEVDVRFTGGTIHALVGASGSGKTTLAQHVNALLKPRSGRVLLDERDIWKQPLLETRRRVGLVFQFPELQLFADSVAEDVSFGPRNMGYSEQRIAALVEQAMDWVNLPIETFGTRAPMELSGGEKRRVALAGVLAMDPDVLVLDEPTAGLDPASTRSLCALLVQLASTGKAIVLIAHDMDLVAELADYTTALCRGRVVLQGTTRSVLADESLTERSQLLPPTATGIARRLRQRGWPLPHIPLTLEELKAMR